jgi:hypothetical protein
MGAAECNRRKIYTYAIHVFVPVLCRYQKWHRTTISYQSSSLISKPLFSENQRTGLDFTILTKKTLKEKKKSNGRIAEKTTSILH